MNRLKQKLNSTRGASIIIAMVFMLICLFVGGSVLVAATMNTHRIKHAPQHQVFMDRRSAAMLIADDLRAKPGNPLNVIITKTTTTKWDATKAPNGKLTLNTKYSPTVVYDCVIRGMEESDNMIGMKRLAAEAAIRSYQSEHADFVDGNSRVYIRYADDTEVSLKSNSTWPFLQADTTSGEVTVTPQFSASGAEEQPDPFIAKFALKEESHLPNTKGKNFIVNFKDKNGNDYSMLEVRMYGSQSDTHVPVVEEIIKKEPANDKSDKYTRCLTEREIRTYTWTDPVIEKTKGV